MTNIILNILLIVLWVLVIWMALGMAYDRGRFSVYSEVADQLNELLKEHNDSKKKKELKK